jgi:purine-binding chemotaxis protein CheW
MQSAQSESIPVTGGEPLYLTFALAGQDYAVPIMQVQEIREWRQVTPLPNSPRYIRGVLNLRGAVIPVMDTRLRLQLETRENDAHAAIIVVNIDERLTGLVVDSVNDVLRLGAEELRGVPEFEGQQGGRFLAGLAQVDGRLLILLDVERLLGPAEPVTGTGPDH